MSRHRQIEVEIEVPATPEQAWEAIATGPGITSWFMPAEVDGGTGGTVVHRHDGQTANPGTITTYDRPHRFGYEEREELVPGDGPRVLATEFLIEARGGACVVRVVMSGFGDGEAWERAIGSFAAGWRQALGSLRLYLAHFRGEPVGSIVVGTMTGADRAWERLTAALALPERPAVGDRVEAGGAGTPALAGTVAAAGDGMVSLLLERPAHGIGLIGVGRIGDGAFLTVRAQVFGDDAVAVAAREQRAWREWLASRWG